MNPQSARLRSSSESLISALSRQPSKPMASRHYLRSWHRSLGVFLPLSADFGSPRTSVQHIPTTESLASPSSRFGCKYLIFLITLQIFCQILNFFPKNCLACFSLHFHLEVLKKGFMDEKSFLCQIFVIFIVLGEPPKVLGLTPETRHQDPRALPFRVAYLAYFPRT